MQRIILDNLSIDTVRVVQQEYIIQNEKEYILENISTAYMNTEKDRNIIIQSDLPSADKESIFSKWGNSPTVIESENSNYTN